MTILGQPVPELPVSDLERARSYYCEKLGFERKWEFPDIASVARGDLAIFFRKSVGPVAPQVHWIYADDIEATYKEMNEAGVNIVDPIADKPWGLRQFTIQDPDGHRFHIHHDL